ncbi:MAG: argininosuccinate synthase [Chloroflexi bacterium]|nr:argininosuccinate synthase [Chloroflexota bacterium]
MTQSRKIVLAYSGGLDTSVILHWLVAQGHQVVTFTANLGQQEDWQEEDWEEFQGRAYTVGASQTYVEDLREEFVTQFIFPAIRANAVYEGRYLLGTSLARPLTARAQVQIARREQAQALAHGATGKGNDQVRFEFTYQALAPDLEVYAPWRDPEFLAAFQGRPDLLRYARRNNIPVKASRRKPWSTDANLMHISYEAGELEDPRRTPRESMFTLTRSPRRAPNQETVLEITFHQGDPVRVVNRSDGAVRDSSLGLFAYLNAVGGLNGIGRVDMVENRFVGIKSRGVYETPAGTILHLAHRDLEGVTLDREVMHLRDSLMPRFAELVYYGLWFSPEMEVLRALLDKSQEYVTGTVTVGLYKGNVTIKGRASPVSLYDQDLASMDRAGGFTPTDSTGFIRTHAQRLRASALRARRGEGRP